jgi:tetratricopeptide (TPR) repeat protein
MGHQMQKNLRLQFYRAVSSPRVMLPAMLPNDEITRAANLFNEGKYTEAAEIFLRLCERADAPSDERAFMGANLATTYDKLGDTARAADTYQYAAGMAMRSYVQVQELRAAYLFEHARKDDAIAVWEHLLSLDLLMPDRQEIIRHNLNVAVQGK